MFAVIKAVAVPVIAAVLLAVIGPMPADAPAPANQAMEARLRAIYRASDWKADPTKPAERAAYFQLLLRSGKLSTDQQRIVYPQLSNELLKAGDPTASLETLAAYEKLPGLSTQELHDLHSTRAIAFLRLGEQENCLSMHGQRACVFPLRASAVHAKPRGAEGAVAEFTYLLDRDPRDALSRWLLNIAYMQLGRSSGCPGEVSPSPEAL